jgi:XTP/dITP diphosphohydrolase
MSRIACAPHFLASRNPHKTKELAAMLGSEFTLEDLRNHPEIPEVIEDGATFAENARLKAVAISRQLPGLVLADDSGLEVDSLGGAPGIFSARYAGAEASDEANRQKLLTELAKRGADAARTARFHCALALARDGRVLAICEGSVAGEIVRRARGSAGFGYDPLFQPNGFSKTFAELPAATKDSISHRGEAVTRMKAFIRAANLPK